MSQENAVSQPLPDYPDNPEDRLGMTEAQWRRFQEWTRGYGEQDENGIDTSLLRENLKLTPTQRLEKLERARRFFHEAKRAGELQRE